ncbi:beta-propeller domain-containing protein [Allorhizocola rhizosphaerae]|uniref:beta-propeller domain-containing protein n=1 Tax=Allorhizocola rhizosphaerae TaxID=1872709 RepID=UPI001B8D1D30|nr:beta-propeller domain-containing protein [Allorhizocola rhizosphaerae]
MPALKLVAYASCDELLASVRQAAKASVGPYGFTGGGDLRFGIPEMARADALGALPPAAAKAGDGGTQQQGYSGTNTHEKGVDEPDLVKTDGKRVVVVKGGSLHVIDAASRRETHRLPVDQGAHQILLSGDRVLVLSGGYAPVYSDMPTRDIMPSGRGTTLIQMIDIGGAPKVVGEFKIDARLIGARQVGSMVRIVTASTPKVAFPRWESKATVEQKLAANRETIDKTPIDAWLPDIVVNGQSRKLDCGDISRPDEFSGASMVTLLSFNLGAATLSQGDPVVLMADGDTVYGSGPNLYVANDQRWRMWRSDVWNPQQFKPKTDFYQYDVTTPKPTYVASGTVPGWLLNQYSMSEFDGVLRVATTSDAEGGNTSSSSVYTLAKEGGSLKQIGEVGGLGKGERIYAVRFVGKIGYVVTFRQTDPLYTLDLGDPRRPRVVGELKIPGYSAYLHPVSDSRLIGVGQDATEQGRVQGTQVSLFDVGNLAEPKRVAQHKIARAHSEAESDPHAFLYWPETKLLVIPVNSKALLLRVDNATLTEIATVSHSSAQYGDPIRRSLVIGDTLWTISHRGAMASSLDGARELAFVNL